MKSCPKCNYRYPDESTYCFADGAVLEPLKDPRVGSTIAGRYLIENVLGEGGMATVYRARHTLTDRPCAVKILNPALARDTHVRERFRREARSARKLAHPNIIDIFDDGDTGDGTSFMVMELLDGQPLDALVTRGPMSLPKALPIMIQIARGIARAHDLEVIHRDLKPENIFIAKREDGSDLVKLLDFGIARSMQDSRLTGAGEVFGTPQYMAPERITSIDAGGSQDLYALGVIFFEMLSAQLPFDAPDVPSFLLKHLKEPAPRLSSRGVRVPLELENLIDSLMAKDPKNRPIDAHRVYNELVAISQKQGVSAPPEIQYERRIRAPAATLPPVGLDRWAKRILVFDQMLQRAFSHTAPPDQKKLIEKMRTFLSEATTLRANNLIEQRKHETLEQNLRDGRERFGRAVDALGIDVSNAKEEARKAREGVAPYTESVKQAASMVKQFHADVLHWEGRSGFQHPHAELSAAYRKCADLVDHWLNTVQLEKQAIAWAEAKEQEANDLDFQIKELRAQLKNFEANIEKEQQSLEQQLAYMGKKTSEYEGNLLELAAIFCEPIRGRPELASLFAELEADNSAVAPKQAQMQ